MNDPSEITAIDGEPWYYIENLSKEELFKLAFFKKYIRNNQEIKKLPEIKVEDEGGDKLAFFKKFIKRKVSGDKSFTQQSQVSEQD